MMKGRHHQDLLRKARGLVPLRTAVVHPVDEVSLSGAIEAGREGLIIPVLVGPEDKIRAAADAAGLTSPAMSSCRPSIATRLRPGPSNWPATARSRR